MSSNTYALVLFVHLLAASILVGSSLFLPLARSALRRAGTVGDARTWLAFQHRMAMLNPLSAAIVLATGLYLGTVGWSGYAWFKVAVASFIASSLVAAVGVRQLEKRLEQALTGAPGDPLPAAAEQLRWSIGWDLTGSFLLASDIAMLLLMVRKPALMPSIAIILGASALIAVASLLLRHRAAPRTLAADPAASGAIELPLRAP